MPTTPTARSESRPQLRRRLALAGLLGAAVLGSGAGFAYAGSASADVVETGYATVADSVAADCPGRAGDTAGDTAGVTAGNTTGDSTGGL